MDLLVELGERRPRRLAAIATGEQHLPAIARPRRPPTPLLDPRSHLLQACAQRLHGSFGGSPAFERSPGEPPVSGRVSASSRSRTLSVRAPWSWRAAAMSLVAVSWADATNPL